MPEVSVEKKSAENRSENREANQPLGRYFGSSPFGLAPLAIMRQFASDMDRMFRGSDLQSWAPTLDVQHCGGNLVVSAELPGLKKEDVKVEIFEDTLVIQGERKQEHKQDHEGYHRFERNYGRFYRAIQLPQGAKADDIKAELKDGILKVSVPVPEESKKSRQVPVSG